MAYAVGGISGGHFNPAVSLGLAIAGRFEYRELIGYWIAQLIGGIALHRGEIRVESAPGEGTTFHICLPAAQLESELAADRAPSIPRGRGERILKV